MSYIKNDYDLYAMLINNVVEQVLVFKKEEDLAFIQKVCQEINCESFVLVDDSYKPSIGDTWNVDHFESPKPYPSWTWGNGIWNPPVEKPFDEEGVAFVWNEEEQKWQPQSI
jgi:hypothetical protein